MPGEGRQPRFSAGQPGPEPPGSEPLEQPGSCHSPGGWLEGELGLGMSTSCGLGCERWCQWWNCSEVPWWPWRPREGPLCWFLSASAPSCWLGVNHRGNRGCSGFPLPTGKGSARGPRGKRLTKGPGQETLVADVPGGEWQLVPVLKVQFQQDQWKERWEVRSESF